MTEGIPSAPRARVRELDIDGEITLYDGTTSTALVLNRTASDVWRLLDGQRSVADIVALLSTAYAVDETTLQAGVEDTLARLRSHGLLEDGG